MKVLVTGSNGQLGSELQFLAQSTSVDFTFVGSKEFDITNEIIVNETIVKGGFSYVVNCAAYTAVDVAEDENDSANEVNNLGVEILANACKVNNVTLIHVSTDFVFDGESNTPYLENDRTDPINVYGVTKRNGEIAIVNTLEEYFIIRTSWLYSTFGKNFVSTMLKLAELKDEFGVIADQIGTPTYARDLASVILKIIIDQNTMFGIYHYSNQGVASWYDFAHEIFSLSEIKIKLNSIGTESYPTPAKRPKYSVMSKGKIMRALNLEIPHWRDSLKQMLTRD